MQEGLEREENITYGGRSPLDLYGTGGTEPLAASSQLYWVPVGESINRLNPRKYAAKPTKSKKQEESPKAVINARKQRNKHEKRLEKLKNLRRKMRNGS